MGKAHRLAVLAAAAVAASGCASTASTTTDPTHGISRICRQRLSHHHRLPHSEAEDLAQSGEAFRLNEQVVTRIRRLALPPSLRREVDASLLPAIIRLDQDFWQFKGSLRSDDYKRAYFLNLEDNRLADKVTTIARRLRLAGCY